MSAQSNPQKVGVIGWPVEHSISPAMINAAFQALAMNWQYEALAVEPYNLRRVIHSLQARGYQGVNVTVPHKNAVVDLLDVVPPEIKALGAVNTVSVMPDGTHRLKGDNTDIMGFYRDLTKYVRATPDQSRALILGAGGAARAAAFVLARLGYRLQIASRNPTRGLEVIRDVQAGLSILNVVQNAPVESTQWRMQMLTVPWQRLPKISEKVDLIVNCTPVGMWPNVDESPWPDDAPINNTATVYDMIYRPQQTRFLQQAEEAGAQAVGGLGMLVQQGAESFRLWTGQDAPIDVMTEAAKRALDT